MELKYIKKLYTIPYTYYISYTAVSTKVVPQKSKSVRGNGDWYYG